MNYNHDATVRHDTAARHLHKYRNRNVFHRFALNRFIDAVVREIRQIQPTNVFEFGCGEGFFLHELGKKGLKFESFVGLDIRRDAIEIAQKLHPEYFFIEADFFTWEYPVKSFDLVIASQVLEHLMHPENFIERLVAYSSKHLLLTVPWEPWFSIMNLIRGRDIFRGGNHPEHINHWGIAQFERLLARYMCVNKIQISFPFIIVTATV